MSVKTLTQFVVKSTGVLQHSDFDGPSARHLASFGTAVPNHHIDKQRRILSYVGDHRRLSAVEIFLSPRATRRMEPPMNADGFARFAPFRPGIEHRFIGNRFISIELFADGRQAIGWPSSRSRDRTFSATGQPAVRPTLSISRSLYPPESSK
jgi:hypothetical protein